MIDRETETAELSGLMARPGPVMALLYGRRRVGKTFLVNHVWPEAQTFYYVASDATGELNRRELLAELSRWSGDQLQPEDFPTWRTVFRHLLALRPQEPLVVVLDEYQYLRDQGESVDSQLAAVWEEYKNRGRTRERCVLVLCGSIVETMERLDAAGSPLYGRIDWKHRLQPFDYWNAGRLASFPRLMDRAWAYGIYGGTPRYLAAVDPARSLAENAASAVLAPRGAVRAQVETVVEQEKGLRNIAEYKAVLGAIGHGSTERNAIALAAGLKNDAALRAMLDTLTRLEFVESRRNFAAASNEPFRYRISDPALRFYYSMVSRYRSELETNDPLEVWNTYLAAEMPQYMGLVFEDVARQAYQRLRARLRLPMVREWSRWEGVDRARQPVEIDVVARLTDGRVMTGAVKARSRSMGITVHRAHLLNLQRLADSGRGWATEALQTKSPLLYVSTSGFTPDFRAAAEQDEHPLILWELADLYQE